MSPNYAGIFLDFVHGFDSYVKSAENKTMQFGGRSDSVYM